MNKLSVVLVVLGLFVSSALVAALPVGEPAPDFTLTDSNGEERSLADLRGKYVVLEWINHGCPFVQKHYGSGNMQEVQKQLTAEGVEWLVINSSAPGQQGHMTAEEANRISKEKGAAHSALLLDHDGEVGQKYGAKVTPHMYLIDPEGTLIYNGAIDSIPTDKVADLERAENYVLAAFSASTEGKPVEHPVTKPYGCGIKYPN